MKNRIIYIPILLLIILLLYEKIDYKNHIKVINNIFYDGGENRYDYIGYIEIKNLNIKREIVVGINDRNLLSHVCLDENSIDLANDHIILAGHSIKNIFGNLHNIELNEVVEIHTFNNTYLYEVRSIDIVSKYDTSVLDEGELILITCMTDNNKRLIIKAKRI